MKKFALSLLIFFCAVVAIAQPYKSMFGLESSVWITIGNGSFDNPHNGSIRTSVCKGDTIHNGKLYKKLCWGSECILFREELDSGIVWYLHPCWPVEEVYMDYRLQVGDTFEFTKAKPAVELKIVDSVYYKDNRKHIRLKYRQSDIAQLTFIEGVGHNYGILSHYNNYCGYLTVDELLRCFYIDGVNVYSYNDEKCLPFTTTVNNINSSNKITITPNPAKNKIHISDITGITKLTLTDMLGKTIVVWHQPVKEIDVSSLATGMYLLVLQSSEQSKTYKFVKE